MPLYAPNTIPDPLDIGNARIDGTSAAEFGHKDAPGPAVSQNSDGDTEVLAQELLSIVVNNDLIAEFSETDGSIFRGVLGIDRLNGRLMLVFLGEETSDPADPPDGTGDIYFLSSAGTRKLRVRYKPAGSALVTATILLV